MSESQTREHDSESDTVIKVLNFWQRRALQHTHPIKFFLDAIGFMWFLYFLYQQMLAPAFIVAVVFPGVGSVMTRNIDFKRQARTLYGSLWLRMVEPIELVCLAVGYFAISFGVWSHSTIIVLCGVSVAALGYFLAAYEVYNKGR